MRKGLERIRTLGTTKQRSIPLKQRSPYIELYLLSKERNRFIAESERLAKQMFTAQERLGSLETQMQRLQGVLNEREDAITQKQAERTKQWNTIKLSY